MWHLVCSLNLQLSLVQQYNFDLHIYHYKHFGKIEARANKNIIKFPLYET